MTAEEKLIRIYENAQKKLINTIERKSFTGSPAVYERRMLAETSRILRELRKQSRKGVEQLVMAAWKTAIDDMIDQIPGNLPSAYTSFSRINQNQINILAHNAVTALESEINKVGRRVADIIRKSALDANAHKLASAGTVQTMKKDLIGRLYAAKVTNVRYKGGRTMPLDKYAAMVARTTTAETQNKSVFLQAGALGYDLVKCSYISVTCDVCAMYQDRVYALTEEAANGKYYGLRFPLLYKTVLRKGYETIHPNCRHRFVILVPQGYTREELSALSSKSMQPFEDTRTEEQRRAYINEQIKNRNKNDDRNQWHRYKIRLGDDAPTFSGFRRMKRADSDRWKQLQQSYRDKK